jgi:DNA-binding NtrC family response regulator
MNRAQVLLVEDDVVARTMLAEQLRASGCVVCSVESGEAAVAQLRARRFDLVVTDLVLEQMDGLGVVRAARRSDPHLEIVVITGVATLESAIAACNHGPCRYLLKPVRPGEIAQIAAEAAARRPSSPCPTYTARLSRARPTAAAGTWRCCSCPASTWPPASTFTICATVTPICARPAAIYWWW